MDVRVRSLRRLSAEELMLLELWCCRRLLRVPWTARRSNQSILKEINPKYSLVGLMLKQKLQYFGHLKWRADSLENTLMMQKTGCRKRRGKQRMRWLDAIIHSMDRRLCISRRYWRTGQLGVLYSWDSKELYTIKGLSNNWKNHTFDNMENLWNKLSTAT